MNDALAGALHNAIVVERADDQYEEATPGWRSLRARP
jgi:hypothetical protein